MTQTLYKVASWGKKAAEKVLTFLIPIALAAVMGAAFPTYHLVQEVNAHEVDRAHWEGERQFLQGEVNRPPSPTFPQPR